MMIAPLPIPFLMLRFFLSRFYINPDKIAVPDFFFIDRSAIEFWFVTRECEKEVS